MNALYQQRYGGIEPKNVVFHFHPTTLKKILHFASDLVTVFTQFLEIVTNRMLYWLGKKNYWSDTEMLKDH